MRIPALATALLILGSSLWASAPGRAEGEALEKAVAAAEAWLQHVDRGELDKSWETAAVLFRQTVPRETWIEKVTAARAPLGKRVWRKVILTKYETQLPAAPPGEYVVIQFKTVFEEAAYTVETVTPMKDPDGEWRVSGYYIK
jgi:hypothetical protein